MITHWHEVDAAFDAIDDADRVLANAERELADAVERSLCGHDTMDALTAGLATYWRAVATSRACVDAFFHLAAEFEREKI